MEVSGEDIQGTYAAILRAVLNRCGGALRIAPGEMPDGLYTIGLHDTAEGGIEVVLYDGEIGMMQ